MWIWILLSPVLLVLLIALVGMLMPETYRATGRLQMPFAAAELWVRLTDPQAYPMSGRMCQGVELLPAEDGRSVWIEDIKQSKLRITDVERRPHRFLRRELRDTVVPFRGEATFEIVDEGGRCTVTCRNVSTIASGTWHVPFFRVMVGLFGGARAGCKDYLIRLAGGQGEVEWLDAPAP